MRPPPFGLVPLLKFLDWVTDRSWSWSPHGMGCTHRLCPNWEFCKSLGKCDAVTQDKRHD